mmetsp:Transcript_19968/g.34355  ORF Transcript_19968/g.34355 Transcript_19968/m.34355 type:complete len:314 (-) Transcript_19968:315-1256(-)|eukprot:CAMPEP_0183737172 /NCGR_PEP_ID=MMETSP0737-20130205/51215_1 /TAXON_ID=385413 /ORGANISM="Thalassiosira miniscula, Strain CCMP1093" /LENGTH=313 /DNA_ID=CAMNT_0025971391 /DNA_START=28 /DNA_END=969 /DNA_ORIENTATION=+
MDSRRALRQKYRRSTFALVVAFALGIIAICVEDIQLFNVRSTASFASRVLLVDRQKLPPLEKNDLEKFKIFRRYFGEVLIVSPNSQFREIRDRGVKALHNWSYVSREVLSTGHPWCSLYRDNWVCTGERYKQVLRETAHYDKSFSLNAFPSNSSIYIEGNSWMAELVYTAICNSDVDRTWLLGGITANSIFVNVMRTNVTLLLVSNHPLQGDPEKSTMLLKDINFNPDVIVRGSTNEDCRNGNPNLELQHMQIYTGQFPNAPYIERKGQPLVPNICRADFSNCNYGKNGHTCLPGPVNTNSELLVQKILSVLK